MHQAFSSLGRFSVLITLALLLCTGSAGAALSDHPVVTGISGPSYLTKDDQGVWYGTYTFTATVTCGSPPYTYKWINPKISPKPIFEGTQYSTVKIPVSKLSTNPDEWGVWLTVTDSAGRDALWMRTNGLGNSNEFLYLLRVDELTRTSFTKITEPATFPPAPSGCAQASAGTGSSSGGSSASDGGDGDLPLVPIAAGVGVVAVAGIAGAKLLGGRSAAGGGETTPDTPPDTPPDTTRTWTDDRGMERTATLQPDGTWTSDTGSTVDLDKTDDARRQHQNDLRHSAEQRAGQIADDTGKADADRNTLDAIRAETAKAAKAPKDYKDYVDWKQKQDQGYSDLFKRQAGNLDTLVKTGEYTVVAADFGVNVLGTMTGATVVKTGYTLAKNLGKNMSSSYQKGESLWKGAVKGGLESGYDLGFDTLKKKLPAGPGNWEFKPGAGSVLTPLGNGVAGGLQSQAVKTLVKDPIKDVLKKGSDKLLGSQIGTFK